MIPLSDDNPTQRTPYVTYALIATCVLAFLWQLSLGPRANQQVVTLLGVIPALLFNNAALPEGVALIPPVGTVFSSMFLHGGWMHLLGNMLFLWVFSDNVEDVLGRARFILFYLLCGVAAVLAQALPDTQSVVPMIGASGAISGVLGAYIVLFPHKQVLVAIPLFVILYTVRLPALVVLGFWFGLQLLSSVMTPAGAAGVAFGAHVGGFVAGLILVHVFRGAARPGPAR